VSIQANIEQLQKDGYLRVENQQIVPDNGILSTLKHYFIPSYHTNQVKKVIQCLKERLRGIETREEALKLSDALIVHYGADKKIEKKLRKLDCVARPLRADPSAYLHPENALQFSKWVRASQPEEIFHRFPKFAEFLHQSKLLSQIKITRDTLQIIEGEPALLVEGDWMKESDLKKRFKVEYSERYGTSFITDCTSIDHDVYTYLDNGRGLEKYHPYQTIGHSISKIDDEAIEKVRAKANAFIRPEEAELSQEERDKLNESRPFVMQIVSSYTKEGRSNFSETLCNPRHVYARLVAGMDQEIQGHQIRKGDIFEWGFGWKRGLCFPLEATQGHLCTLDPWEYMFCAKRIVTNIPLSIEEMQSGFLYAILQQNKQVKLGREIGFQLTKQNCTVFDRKFAEQTGIAIPTEIKLKPLLFRILPDVLKRLGSQIASYSQRASDCLCKSIRACTPACVADGALSCAEKIHRVYTLALNSLEAAILLPVRILLGGLFGDGGESFDEGKQIQAPARNPDSWFDLSSYRYNLPAILQEWQMKQPSTVVYENPVRLTIVPL